MPLGGALLVSACTAYVHTQTPTPAVNAEATADVSAGGQPAGADGTAAANQGDYVQPEVEQGEPDEVTATTEPPEPIYEEQPEPPAPETIWVGGYWGWTGSDWAWYGGRWMAAPEGRVYVEPYYERVGGRVVFVRGYWGFRGATHHSYGGDRIAFAAATRPAGYRRGMFVRVDHRPGIQPGARPVAAYAHATGSVRPLPQATSPRHAEATGRVGPGRQEPAAHAAVSPRPTGHDEHNTMGSRTQVQPTRQAPPVGKQAPRTEPARRDVGSARQSPAATHPAPGGHSAPPSTKRR